MTKDKLEKLKNLGDMSISASEIADARLAIMASSSKCKKCHIIAKWVIKEAVATGTCAAGEAALDGIFLLADIVFFEADEILIPLEAVIGVAWAVTCADVGIAVLGKNADKYADLWCKEAKIC